MRSATAGACALIMAATAFTAAGASNQVEQDGATVLSYMMRLFNAESAMKRGMRAQFDSSGLDENAQSLVAAALARIDLNELVGHMAPIVASKVSATDLHTCAQAVRQPGATAALAAVPVSEDQMGALQQLSPAHQNEVVALMSLPCMKSVNAALLMPETQDAGKAYGRSLACKAFEHREEIEMLRRAGHCTGHAKAP